MFCVRGFAGTAVQYSGFVGIVTAGISTAANAAGKRHDASKDVRQTSAINRVSKGDSITGIVNAPIEAVGHDPA